MPRPVGQTSNLRQHDEENPSGSHLLRKITVRLEGHGHVLPVPSDCHHAQEGGVRRPGHHGAQCGLDSALARGVVKRGQSVCPDLDSVFRLKLSAKKQHAIAIFHVAQRRRQGISRFEYIAPEPITRSRDARLARIASSGATTGLLPPVQTVTPGLHRHTAKSGHVHCRTGHHHRVCRTSWCYQRGVNLAVEGVNPCF